MKAFIPSPASLGFHQLKKIILRPASGLHPGTTGCEIQVPACLFQRRRGERVEQARSHLTSFVLVRRQEPRD